VIFTYNFELELQRYLKNEDSIGWVPVWWRYMTQKLLSVQKHLSFTLQWLCQLQVHVFTWWTITPILGVTTFTFTITTTIALWIHVYNNVAYDIRNNPVSFQIFFLDIFNMLPVSLLVSFVTTHTNSFPTCSNFWRYIPAVLFSCAGLFNLAHVSSIGLGHTSGGSQTAWPWLANMRSILLISH